MPTWPRLLQQAGYRTGMVGKWHLSDDPAGFDYSCILPGQGVYGTRAITKDLPTGLDPAARKKWIYQRFVKDRYRTVYGVDENLGRVLRYLDEDKLAQDTLILYTSDNGFFPGEHGWYDKRFM